MPRLRYRDQWFYEVAPSSLRESDFENILIQNADCIRSNSTVVSFKRTVYAEGNSARADLALIAKDFREWYIIEVELVQHSLYGHVVPQVRTLRDASYGPEDALYLSERNPNLDKSKLLQMLRGAQPRIVVIMNKVNEEWARTLRRHDAHVMVFEIYRSDRNQHIFLIDAELPRDLPRVVSYCRPDQLIPRALVVSSPAMLHVAVGGRAEMIVGGQLTMWQRVDTKTDCYLMSCHRVELPKAARYALIDADADRLELQPLA